MNQSFPKTVAVPSALALGPPRQEPPAIARAADVLMRVLVRNLDAINPVFLGVEQQALAPEIGSDTFELPPSTSEVFPLAPGQKLYARGPVALAASVRVSIFTSDAFPVELLAKHGA